MLSRVCALFFWCCCSMQTLWHRPYSGIAHSMVENRHKVSVKDRTIIAVADPHLESIPDDVAYMVRFVNSLDPAAHVLVFLGDLFHTWTASPSYHSGPQQELMDSLGRFRSQGGAVYLTVGNRDLFFKDAVAGSDANGLPFDVISRESIRLDTANGLVLALHGDTVNRDDSAYLRWRRFVRSAAVEKLFRFIPVETGKKIISALEKKIKTTNQRFRIDFPHDNWSRFVSDHSRDGKPNLLLVGHFHPEQPIITQDGDTTAIVVPSWHPARAYLEIDTRLGFQVKRFHPDS